MSFPAFEMQWKMFSAKRPNRLGGCYIVDRSELKAAIVEAKQQLANFSTMLLVPTSSSQRKSKGKVSKTNK